MEEMTSYKPTWEFGTLDEIERDSILIALTILKGNRTHTARALGITVRTLRNRLAQYRKAGIEVMPSQYAMEHGL